MSDIVIRVENIGKQFHIGALQKYDTLRDRLAAAFRPKAKSEKRKTDEDNIWALKDVNFEIKQGEVVGVIGRNGAGKSTLLKILSKITEPTVGRVELHGRVGSLLEVGTGFHPELTGRENVFLNGAILGMKKVEIKRRFDEIVAFSEVERFIDTPVKHYSSGMYMRLAFAVAAHLDPEILLVDEVLAVGDAQFQKKCLGKMGDVAKQGRTVLFVSHNMGAIISICPETLLLDAGKFIRKGNSVKIVEDYVSSAMEIAGSSLIERKDRIGSGNVRLMDVSLIDCAENSIKEVISGQKAGFRITYKSANDLLFVRFKLTIYNHLGQPVIHLDNEMSGQQFSSLAPVGSVICWLDHFPLSPGLYRINISINKGTEILDHINDAFTFTVIASDFYGTGRAPEYLSGICLVKNTWVNK